MAHRLSCSVVWSLPGAEIEPMFPALGGTFLSIEAPGTSESTLFLFHDYSVLSM